MTQEYALNTNEIPQILDISLVRRVSVLMYGLLGYTTGMVSLLWFILAMGGLAPMSFGPLQTTSTIGAIAVNVGLILLFAVQHSIMARPAFKAMMKRFLPVATERASFLLFTGIVLIIALVFWQPLPGLVWQVEQTGAMIGLWALYGIGWTYLLLATFATNHFELMGLRQIYLYFSNQPHRNIPFYNRFMYSYSRHPMMLGLLVGMWCVPVMSVSQFVMAALFTIYVFVGMYFEEKDLLTEFGEKYRKYKNEVAALIPKIY